MARSKVSSAGMPSSGDGGAASSGEALRSGEAELARDEEGATELVAARAAVAPPRPRPLPLPLPRPLPRPLPLPRAVGAGAEALAVPVSESDVEGEVSSDMEVEGAGDLGTMMLVMVGRADRAKERAEGWGVRVDRDRALRVRGKQGRSAGRDLSGGKSEDEAERTRDVHWWMKRVLVFPGSLRAEEDVLLCRRRTSSTRHLVPSATLAIDSPIDVMYLSQAFNPRSSRAKRQVYLHRRGRVLDQLERGGSRPYAAADQTHE